MTVCILTPRYPFPENGGNVLRINDIAKYLKSRNYKVILLSFCEKGKVRPGIETSRCYDEIIFIRRWKIESVFFSLLNLLTGKPIQTGYYYSPRYARALRRVIAQRKPDIYVSHLLRMVPYLERLGLARNTIVEMTDALSESYSLSDDVKTVSMKKIIYMVEKERICRDQQQVIQKI